MKDWFHELGYQEQTVAFPSIRGEPLTRFAIYLLLRKTVEQAQTSCPSLKTKRISPHVIATAPPWPCSSLASTSPSLPDDPASIRTPLEPSESQSQCGQHQ